MRFYSKIGSFLRKWYDKIQHKITRTIDASQVAKCDFCQEMINLNSISRHRDICKNVFQVIKKVSDGYECTICSSIFSKRGNLHLHLEQKHNITKAKDPSVSSLSKEESNSSTDWSYKQITNDIKSSSDNW